LDEKVTDSDKPDFNEALETASIMQVTDNETNSFFNGDCNAWANNWRHASYAMQAWNNDEETFSAALGWDSINAQGKRWIEKYYANGRNVIHPLVKKEKPLVKFFNNTTAYLIWKQYNADKDMKMYQVSQETRLLEKQADGWKIVNVTALWNSKEKIPVDSLKISP
jgi:predicted trehalose synthase